MLNITRASDPIEVKYVIGCVYGYPFAGKSSLGFTTDKPLVLDFDEGAHRSDFRKDIVRIHSWDDVAALTRDDLAPYNTLVVDTAGRLLDKRAAALIEENRKLANVNGALTQTGWGTLKGAYAQWLATMRSYDLDILQICHEVEKPRGDDMIFRPDVQGGSYGEIFRSSDFVGRLYIERNKRVIDWSPTDSSVGKDPAKFGKTAVPSFHDEPNYMANVIKTIKESLNRMSEQGKAVVDEVGEWRDCIVNMESAEQVNTMIGSDAFSALKNPTLAQVKKLIASHAKELGLKYEGKRGEGKYV